MAAIGILTVYVDASSSIDSTFEFYNATFPESGFPIVDAAHQIDPINAMGVNFTRDRIIREDAEPFTAVLHGDQIDWTGAVAKARALRKARGKLCSLAYTAGGVSFNLINKFVIQSVNAIPLPGSVTSPNTTFSDPQAIVVLTTVLRYVGLDL